MFTKRMVSLPMAALLVFINWGIVHADWVHRVSPKETLGAIAKRYGMTIDTLLGNNQYITNPDMVYAGQVLIIPGANKQAYQVKTGDTLFMIARQFEISMELLANFNQLANPNILNVGQTLIIPKIYTVKAGDTLYKIAAALGVSMDDLALENNLRDRNSLSVGQTLFIPFQSSEKEDLAANERVLSAVASRFPNTFFYKGPAGSKRIALTFDDGPGRPITSKVLDILEMYDVRATFFLLGSNMAGNGDIVKRAAAQGHTIANHTWSHPDISKLTGDALRKEIINQENEIKSVTGLKTALMRPPYGFVSDQNLNQLDNMGYRVVKWTVDSKDWRDHNVDQVLINTMPYVRDGSIILMHDYLNHPTTQQVLPEIIQSLRWQGYTFVTANELLGVNAYQ